ATNTFTGKVTVNAGAISIGAGNTERGLGGIPAAFTPDIVTINGGTLTTTNTSAIAMNLNRGVTVGAAGATVNITGSTFSFNGAVTGATGTMITKTGTGILSLVGNSSATYNGKYTILNGELNPNNADTGFGVVPSSPTAD